MTKRGYEIHHAVSPEVPQRLRDEFAGRLRERYAGEWDVPLDEFKTHQTITVEDPLHDTIITYWKSK